MINGAGWGWKHPCSWRQWFGLAVAARTPPAGLPPTAQDFGKAKSGVQSPVLAGQRAVQGTPEGGPPPACQESRTPQNWWHPRGSGAGRLSVSSNPLSSLCFLTSFEPGAIPGEGVAHLQAGIPGSPNSALCTGKPTSELTPGATVLIQSARLGQACCVPSWDLPQFLLPTALGVQQGGREEPKQTGSLSQLGPTPAVP